MTWVGIDADITMPSPEEVRFPRGPGLLHVFVDGSPTWWFEPLPVSGPPRLVRSRSDLALVVTGAPRPVGAPEVAPDGVHSRSDVILWEWAFERRCAVVFVCGPPGSGRMHTAVALQRRLGGRQLRVRGEDLPGGFPHDRVDALASSWADAAVVVTEVDRIPQTTLYALAWALKSRIKHQPERPVPRGIIVTATDGTTARRHLSTWFSLIELRPLADRIDHIPHLLQHFVDASQAGLALGSEFVETCMRRRWRDHVADLRAAVMGAIEAARHEHAGTLLPRHLAHVRDVAKGLA